MIYTTGAPEDEAEKIFKSNLDANEYFLETLYGYTETLYAHFTYQFKDYSKYDLIEGLKELRDKQREEQFPKDLQNAYELGKRLVKKAKEFQSEKKTD